MAPAQIFKKKDVIKLWLKSLLNRTIIYYSNIYTRIILILAGVFGNLGVGGVGGWVGVGWWGGGGLFYKGIPLHEICENTKILLKKVKGGQFYKRISFKRNF